MFVSKHLMHLCVIIHYTKEENIFFAVVYKLLAQKNIKMSYSRLIKISEKVKPLNLKVMKYKYNHYL